MASGTARRCTTSTAPESWANDSVGQAAGFVKLPHVEDVAWVLPVECGHQFARISWVVSRDAWWSNRRSIQTVPSLRTGTLRLMLASSEAMAGAASLDDLCGAMEAAGAWLRLDRAVSPGMYHAATVTPAELDGARGIGRILREGKVLALEPGRMRLQGGEFACAGSTLFVDCTASALARNRNDRTPVFEPGRINLQFIRFPAIALSVALIAWIEAHVESEDDRRAMTQGAPMTDTVADWIDRTATSQANLAAWFKNPKLAAWLDTCRLNPVAAMMASIPVEAAQDRDLADRVRALGLDSVRNVAQLAAGVCAATSSIAADS